MARRIRIERLSIVDEAVASLTERKVRTALTALGTVLGVGVLVSILGLTATATSQIDRRFTALSATEVSITQVDDGVRARAMAFPDDFERRVRRLDGVREVGLTWRLPRGQASVSSFSVPQPADGSDVSIDALAASPGALRVAGARAAEGTLFDEYAQRTRSQVALVGRAVASELGIATLAGSPSVKVGGVVFAVVGVVGDVERHPELLNTVVVPSSTARAMWGDPGAEDPPQGWVEVERGAGGVVADQLALATSATQPERFAVVPPPDPTQLRGSVNADLQVLFLVLAGVCLVVGMVGIANTTFVTVMERIGEIGLRRALGASRGQVALQFLVEAALIGLVGGLLGALGGIGVVVAVAVAQSWTAVVPPVLIAVGPALGAATAVVAAAYPAYRGAATEPTAALRLGTS